ncbi:nitroreductase family protein [Actinoplanes sp. LDG1-06]|uniref:Nitroreductase family protein n=1 Tax=Paractinoplanes ovalisporus TaxID=2810368 RepID=A0ABS2APX4_9ACTN|nr:nitroreductase family protein [Actinoplanes ovalisporus]MBM2621860.1 nitroreductase family protein [Actinoplanes ovalisporus]
MEFREALRGRRIVRNYRPDPVPDEVVERIVKVVHRAPSAGFSQGHRLVVVTDPAVRAALAAVAEPWYLENGFEPWISLAPVQIVLGIREQSYHERYTEADKLEEDGEEIPWPVPFWWFDSGALFTLLQLAAADEGLASGFYSPAPPEELAALAAAAGLPDDVAVAGVLTLGYPAGDGAVPSAKLAKHRKPLNELVTWRRAAAS